MNTIENLKNPLQRLIGIGPKNSEIFAAKLNIHNIYDLIMFLPYRYEDMSNVQKFADVKIGERVSVIATVEKVRPKFTPKRRVRLLEVTLSDETAHLNVTLFNYALKDMLKPGSQILLTGQAEYYRGLTIKNPDINFSEDPENFDLYLPVYHLTEDFNIFFVRKTIKSAVSQNFQYFRDFVPENYLKMHNLISIQDAILKIHSPKNLDEVDQAKKRLFYHEFFLQQAALAWRRDQERPKNLRAIFRISDVVHDRIITRIPFELTSDQAKVTEDIRIDLTSDSRMTRLLQGDVGTGKTVVAFYAMLAAVANGFQAVLMAPTEVLAQQHFKEFTRLLADSKVKVQLLTGGKKRSERNLLLDQLKKGEINIVIGTHALIENDVKFQKLGLVVVDEQHKFGVQQRFKLVNKAKNPHLLVMTATPIPRTLALTLYGDLDISTLRDKPTGNIKVNTRFIKPNMLDNLYSFMQARIKNNEQIIYVCPFVEEDIANFENERKSVLNLTSKLKKRFSAFKIDSLFGRMENSEKESVLASFRNGETKIIVTSTVMEVGIDISTATIIVIEDAHRFGLSQLHQLRGRVGRGGKESFCFLIADPQTEEAKKRLSILLKTNDGFEIAEEDLKIRGAGELYGLKQHGVPHFKFANPLENYELLSTARRDAFQAYRNNELDIRELAEQIRLHFGNRFLLATTA